MLRKSTRDRGKAQSECCSLGLRRAPPAPPASTALSPTEWAPDSRCSDANLHLQDAGYLVCTHTSHESSGSILKAIMQAIKQAPSPQPGPHHTQCKALLNWFCLQQFSAQPPAQSRFQLSGSQLQLWRRPQSPPGAPSSHPQHPGPTETAPRNPGGRKGWIAMSLLSGSKLPPAPTWPARFVSYI